MQNATNASRRYARLAAIALIAGGGVSLTACASTDMGVAKPSGLGPRYAARLPDREAERPERRAQASERPPIDGRLRGTNKPYQVKGIWYVPKDDPDYDEVGMASWYGDAFQLRPTANGETFDMYMPSAAHKTLPLPSIVEVTNLDNGRKLKVRVNDRGPFVDGRIIDLSRAAAEDLGMLRSGVAHVRVRYVGPAPTSYQPQPMLAANKPRSAPMAPPPTIYAAAPQSTSGREIRFGLGGQTVGLPPLAEPIQVATVAPPAPSIDWTPQGPVLIRSTLPGVQTAAAQTATGFEVQAGAFSSLANAQRVARQLSSAGAAVVRRTERETGVLYRVVLAGLSDEGMAAAVRERVATLGFPDAKVVRPF